MKIAGFMMLGMAAASLALPPPLARAQSPAVAGDSASSAVSSGRDAAPALPAPAYTRPSEKAKLHKYFGAMGDGYALAGAAIAAALDQAGPIPREWKQDAKGYGQRFASSLAIAGVSTTTRYALSEAFHEDVSYYRCDCTGAFPRLGHALISSFTARHGDDGHRLFSFSVIVAPYAGSMTAVYGWYPSRHGPKDAFRMGNYSLLSYVGSNIAREFFHRRPRARLVRGDADHAPAAPATGPQP
jgi:hypothetical protein